MPRDHTIKIGGDWVDGFLVGKQAALLDWQHEKEAKAFARLCNALYWRKWRTEHPAQAKAYQEAHKAKDPERHRQRQKVRKHRWEEKNPEKVKAYHSAYNRAYYLRNREKLLAKAAARHKDKKAACDDRTKTH